MVHRHEELRILQALLKRHRVVAILGARQVGKTTMARSLAARSKEPSAYRQLQFNLRQSSDCALGLVADRR
jgi:predicted AAA+ superfamily ATPase